MKTNLEKTLTIVMNDKAFAIDTSKIKSEAEVRMTNLGDFHEDSEGQIYIWDLTDDGQFYQSKGFAVGVNPYLTSKGYSAIEYGNLFLSIGDTLSPTRGDIFVGMIADKIRASLRRNGEQICDHDVSVAASEILYRWVCPQIDTGNKFTREEIEQSVAKYEMGKMIDGGMLVAKKLLRNKPEATLEDVSWEIITRNQTTSTCAPHLLKHYRKTLGVN